MSSSDPNAVAIWNSIGARMENEKAVWTEILRARGVVYAHPDDGWVNRERNTHSPSWYPQFSDGTKVGDLIAFGRPPDGDHYLSNHDHPSKEFRGEGKPESASSGYRICRVTAITTERFGGNFLIHYEDTGERMPARKKRTLRALVWSIILRRKS